MNWLTSIDTPNPRTTNWLCSKARFLRHWHEPRTPKRYFSIPSFLISWNHICKKKIFSFGTHLNSNMQIHYAQKCHVHINSTRHFFTITFISILNLITKSSNINIALLHNKILILCLKIWLIGTLMCFIDTFFLLKSICVY